MLGAIVRFIGNVFMFGALAGATWVVLAWLLYYAWFASDYEARADAVAYAAPTTASTRCGDLDPGDNLTCIRQEKDCETADRLDGRWVHVQVGSETCWVRYDELTFQHGAVMSLVGLVWSLETTDQVQARVVRQQSAALPDRVRQLEAAGDREALQQLAEQATAGKVDVPASIRPVFEQARREGAAREAEALAVHAIAAPSPPFVPPIEALRTAQAELAKAPATTPEDDARRQQLAQEVARALCERLLRAAAGEGDPFQAVALLGQAAEGTACTAEEVQPVLQRVLRRLELRTADAPERVIEAARALAASTALHPLAADDISSVLAQATTILEAKLARRMSELGRKVESLARQDPIAAAQAVCALDPTLPADRLERMHASVAARFARAVRSAAGQWLRAVQRRDLASWQRLEEPMLPSARVVSQRFGNEAHNWLEAHPALDPKRSGLRPASAYFDRCFARAEVDLVDRAGRVQGGLVVCRAAREPAWSVCGRPEPASAEPEP